MCLANAYDDSERVRKKQRSARRRMGICNYAECLLCMCECQNKTKINFLNKSFCFIQLASYGYIPCLGIMFADFLADLGLQTKALTLLPSCFFLCCSPIGLFASYLFNRFSLRSVAVFGAILFCSGSLMVVFVRTFNELLIAYGVIQGE